MSATPKKLGGAKGIAQMIKYYLESLAEKDKKTDAEKLDDYYESESLFDANGGVISEGRFINAMHGLDDNGQPCFEKSVRSNRVCGVDMTYSPCKTVSLAWAWAGKGLRQNIEDSFKQAVLSANGIVKHESREYRTKDGEVVPAKRIEIMIASIMHHTSREGDAQLHIHSCHMNNGESGLDTLSVFRSQRTCNAIMNSVLANHLVSMGFDVESDGRGVTIPAFQEFIEMNSKRRNQILTVVEKVTGMRDTANKRQLASAIALATRRLKAEGLTIEQCETVWDAVKPFDSSEKLTATAKIKWSDEGIQERLMKLTNKDRVICEIIEAELGNHTTMESAEARLDQLIAEGEIIALSENDNTMYVSRTAYEQDASFISNADRVFGNRHKVEAVYTDSMNKGQREAMSHACAGDGLVSIEGIAGAGKSYLMNNVREAHEAAGYRVVGVAMANQAKSNLMEEANIREGENFTTIARKLEKDKLTWDSKTLVIIDEAGTASIEQVNRVLEYAAAKGCKVLVTGDTQQLDAIEAANALDPISKRYGSVLLDQGMRQKDAVLRQKIINIRNGSGNIRGFDHSFHNSRDAALTKMVNDATRDDFMIATKRQDCEIINQKARERFGIGDDIMLKAEGFTAPGSKAGVKDRHFGVGDKVQFREKMKIEGFEVMNNMRATIVGVDGDAITFQLQNGKLLTATGDQLSGYDGSHVKMRHAWASTNFSGQGATVNNVLCYGNAMDKRGFYVAMSRCKFTAKAYFNERPYKEQLAGKGIVTREKMRDQINKDIRFSSRNKSTLDFNDKLKLNETQKIELQANRAAETMRNRTRDLTSDSASLG